MSILFNVDDEIYMSKLNHVILLVILLGNLFFKASKLIYCLLNAISIDLSGIPTVELNSPKYPVN